MERRICHHCGLPVRGRGRDSDARVFCCYGCYLAWRIVGEHARSGPLAGTVARLGIAAVLAMNVMMLSLLLYSDALDQIGAQAVHVFRWALLGLAAPAVVILGWPLVSRGVGDIRRGAPGMDSLIALGAGASFAVSAAHVIAGRGHIYFDTATMLLVLVTVGKLLEASARVEASRALSELAELRPTTARVVTEDGEREIPAEEVRNGERVRVRPGERVPADGVVLAGSSSVQESALTGEFDPRVCGPGDRIYGGSVNGEGEITVEATAVGGATLLDQIARLVRHAQMQKSPVERVADRASALFVPAVLAAAAGAAAYWVWRGDAAKAGMSALAVLVVACPCALGLATPLAVCVAVARAARSGVVVRTGEALERLSAVTRVLFDKTGTITRGTPELREIVCCRSASCGSDEALSWLAALESASEHPMAASVVRAARERRLVSGAVEGFRAFPGEGAHGTVTLDGVQRDIWAGSLAFLSQQGIDVSCAAELSPAGMEDTVIFVSWNGRLRARASLTDAPRAGAAGAVCELRESKLRVGVLSGDRGSAAEHIAAMVGIEDVRADCTPAEKIAEVRAAREDDQVVAVVGDGINDAPALAEADVGIAMGSGTDLAREVGDLILLRDDLALVPWAIRLARRARQVIRRNLMWAFGYNVLAIGLAFFGYLHPLAAALAMLGSSVFVLHNSLRFARREHTQAEGSVVEQEA